MQITTTKEFTTDGMTFKVIKTNDNKFEFYICRKYDGMHFWFELNQAEFDKFKLMLLPLF